METKLTVKEAAAILGVSPRRVHALIEDGRIPVERFGNVFAIKKSDLALVSDRPVGRPKKEAEIEIVPGVKKWKAEQQTLPVVAPTIKRAAKRTPAQKTKDVATKKGGKK